jgi:small subunit ribosomal protein S19e
MVTVFDARAELLIPKVADKLKRDLKMPEWAKFVKTGVHASNVPSQGDWWWTRAASILRKVYTDGPVGVNRLRVWYGGSKERGNRPNLFTKAGGKIIRLILQNLESMKYIQKTKTGRQITPEGRKFMDAVAFEVSKSG